MVIATPALDCTCGSIGATKGLRLCAAGHHRFWLGDRRLWGVGTVTSSVLPTDWSQINPAVLENARDRGEWVDRMFMRYLALKSGETMTTDSPRAEDRYDYLERLLNWWDKSGMRVTATQEPVYSEDDGVVGVLDLRIEDLILDLKCVSKLTPVYELQLGGYRDYHPSGQKIGIIHVTKKDVRLVPYKVDQARARYRIAVDWWKVKQVLMPDMQPESEEL